MIFFFDIFLIWKFWKWEIQKIKFFYDRKVKSSEGKKGIHSVHKMSVWIKYFDYNFCQRKFRLLGHCDEL